MFNSKQTTLLDSKSTTSASKFISTGIQKSVETFSGNGSKKYSSTNNDFVDQFGKLGSYKEPRSYKDISNDMSILYANSPLLAVMFILYIRTITRVVSLFNGKKTTSVQRGAGLRHESIVRMIWLHVNHSDVFWKNITLFISVGSWKDIIQMMSYDLQFNGWNGRILDWIGFGRLLLAGLENPQHSELIKKYLPQIKANSKCHTLESQADNVIAKWICSLLYGSKADTRTYRSYRKLKTSGTAHQWQQLISQGKFLQIDFNTIHGRALAQLVSSKFLQNNGLEEVYQKWISTKPIAKFTGYVYELASNIKWDMKKYQVDTINAQYNQLLDLAGKTNSNMIVVKDTSGSMDSVAIGTNVSSYHVAKSLSIFLGNLLQGFFHNHYIDFSSTAILRAIKGSNFVEHWNTESRRQSANTNFMAVCTLFCDIHKKGVPEDQFPSGMICISDGQFDRNYYGTTSIEAFRKQLRYNGFSQSFIDNFKFVFWDINNTFYGSKFTNSKFESFGPEKNVFYFSGFDASVITFLTGIEGSKSSPTNARELFDSAMDQEVLNMVQI
jgi:hypothetical protein